MSAVGGIDTKTDERNVLPTNFLELENLVSTKTGAYSKRNGYSEFVNTILNSSSKVTSGQAVTTFKDELLRFSNNHVYSYSKSQNTWVDKGITKFALASTYGIASNGDKMIQPSHDVISNLTCYAYTRSNGVTDYIEYKIMDSESGNVIATNKFGVGSSPQVVALFGKFYIFYVDSNVTKVRSINFSTPSVISSAVSVLTSFAYAAARIGDRVYVVGKGATTGINVTFVSTSLTVASPVSVSDSDTFNTFAISPEQTTSVRVVYGSNTSARVRTVLLSKDLNYQVHAPVTLLGSGSTVLNLASIQDPTSTNASQIYISKYSAPYSVIRAVVTSAGSVSNNATLITQAALQSLPQSYLGKVYFAISRNNSYAGSVPLRTYFFVSEDGEFMCKFSEDAGVFRDDGSGLPSLLLDGSKMSFAGAEAAEVQPAGAGVVQVPTLIKRYTVDFTQTDNYFDATLGDNIHISGGLLKMYDGDKVSEHGFLLIPDKPQMVSNGYGSVSAILPEGTYQYKIVYKWTDKWGQVHRSAPSPALTYTVPTGQLGYPTIRVLTLPFTKKTDVELEVYRTIANGTTFYKKSVVYGDRVLNDTTAEYVTFNDTTDNGSLTAGELLYTTGGVLDNVAADSSKFITTYKGRAFLISSDGYTLQYSKKREQRSPVQFSDELKITLDENGGAAVALKVMDDNIIIFKENALFALSGEGPNALGEQDDFRQPYLITSDVGCNSPNSLVATPEGIMFKSGKGIYILRRGLSVDYVGKEVEAYNDLTITSATLIPNTNEVRFTTNSDKALVYDYFHKLWFTFTNINAIDSTIYDNTFVFLRANGQLRQETIGSFSDNGSYIQAKIVSSWIQMAGIQGFQRFYEMMVLGTFESKHGLKVQLGFDFNPSWVEEANVDAGAVLNPDIYGTGNYGQVSPYGGQFPLYQFRIFPKRQKCEAFRFMITDFMTSGLGSAFTISNFAAEVGIKPTGNKLGSTRSLKAV